MNRVSTIFASIVLLWTTVCFAGEVEDGFAAYKRGDYKTAAAMWTIAANKGDAKAQNDLGLLYASGQGVAQDYKEAVSWYRKAADQGYAEAQNNLGLTYAKGQGVPQDSTQAVSWFRKAADQDYAEGQINLGAMYANGRGVAQDYNEAASWFRKAAEKGSPRAQLYLASLYEKGLGVPQDYVAAQRWYSLAAENNSLDKEQRELAIKGKNNTVEKAQQAQNQMQAAPPEPAYQPCVAGPEALRQVDDREQKGLPADAMRLGVPMTPERLAEVYIADCTDSLGKLSSATSLSKTESGQLQTIVNLWQKNLDSMKRWIQNRRVKEKQN